MNTKVFHRIASHYAKKSRTRVFNKLIVQSIQYQYKTSTGDGKPAEMPSLT